MKKDESLVREGVQSAKQASAVAEAYADGTTLLATRLRSDPNLASIADRIRAGVYDFRKFTLDDHASLRHQLGTEMTALIQATVLIAEAVRVWRRNHVVYRVHPELAVPLMESKTDSQIPCEVFRRLPHPDPFIAFPTPIPAPVVSPQHPLVGDPEYIGMLVTGFTVDGDLCSTADNRLGFLNIALAGRVQYVVQEPTNEEKTLRIPVTGKHTVDEILHDYMDTIAWHTIGEEDFSAYHLAVALLLYLCSDQREVREHAPKKRKASKRSVLSTIADVGFDVGPASSLRETQGAIEIPCPQGRQSGRTFAEPIGAPSERALRGRSRWSAGSTPSW